MTASVSIVGAGPNGLTAAALLARRGIDVRVYERRSTIGGAASTADVFGSGSRVDLGSAAHPFGVASPVFEALKLEEYGLRWRHSDAVMAHPLDDGPAAVLRRGLGDTADALGVDAAAWKRVHGHVLNHIDDHLENFLGPLLRWPAHPVKMARFGIPGVASANFLSRRLFHTDAARALFAGSAVHAITPPSKPLTAAFALLFGSLGMSRGWPVAEGGSQAISDALAAVATEHGACIYTDAPVNNLDDLPPADATILNLTPARAVAIAGEHMAPQTVRRLRRWTYGPGTFKVDYLLSEPVPWRDPRVGEATTVHVGGTAEEIDAAEHAVVAGRLPRRPFVMVCQQQVADPSRAGTTQGTILWTYAHVPHGYEQAHPGEVAGLIEDQIERFAPGFRDLIVDKHETSTAALERWNPNFVGGDIAGGSMSGLRALLRPGLTINPYRVGRGLYLASGATPPGAGVHGMAGAWAARTAMRDLERGR
ncbi:phytoene desaturase family protein [Corynebacterium uterequi]|uniref:Pyridine nucleotide-disulfide oxidoreductase domain-containing protein 2 n=1 Tax=Corynebacterium uterequi TaxID=1072256 RepID=A0A0G3HAF8_9CORY|nr:NAD(P)/FAD-dependent oxidoreductase [Corynebacterium uterequi]AKK10314.1 phytoene dehydrogenase-like oxidoreductase [Corynebacterium uterequi]